jgi:hypothetical protein
VLFVAILKKGAEAEDLRGLCLAVFGSVSPVLFDPDTDTDTDPDSHLCYSTPIPIPTPTPIHTHTHTPPHTRIAEVFRLNLRRGGDAAALPASRIFHGHSSCLFRWRLR